MLLPRTPHLTHSLLAAALLLTTSASLVWYTLFRHRGPPIRDLPPSRVAYADPDILCVPGARYLDPFILLEQTAKNGTGTTSGDGEWGSAGGIPRLIHQSWMTRELPNKFRLWSHSFRLRHPEWQWVLWTDEANAELVASRHPHLLEVYWGLENNIQRADFVRNLYMWEFGGVYADLDLECLRPLDSLFTQPISESLSPDYPLPSHYHSADPLSTSLAYVGSMNAIPNDWTMEHSIPNAFMASVPRHPLWLLPVSSVLHRFGAEEDGRVRRKAKLFGSNTENLGAETMTGPVALREAVLLYRSVIDLQLEEEGGEEGGEVGGQLASPRTLPGLAPVLGPFADAAPPRHHVAVFDHAIIYPFSWVDDSQPGYRYCRASNWFDFDALRCQDQFRVYERGSRTITYWSHTWIQKEDGKDLSFVGS